MKIDGMIVSDEVIPARAGWSRTLSRGQVLRLVDLQGRQAVDCLCYNAGGYEDRYAAADTMKINGNIFIRKGTVLYSVNCNPMFTMIEDTCGSHDTGRLRRSARRDGRPGGGLQLPADEQPGERLQPDAGARGDLRALGQEPLEQVVEEAPALGARPNPLQIALEEAFLLGTFQVPLDDGERQPGPLLEQG